MVISRLWKKSVPVPQLKLHNNLLERVSSYKYLSVITSDDLTWSTHINEISNKARKIIRLIYRQFYSWSSLQALLQLYISLVIPHLEYVTQVWNLYLARHIDQLEKIQKFAMKVCFKQWRSSYSEILELYTLPGLSVGNSPTFVYKLINNHFEFPNCPLSASISYSLYYPHRNGRSDLFVQPHANSSASFTTSSWNLLPSTVASASTVLSFRRQLLHISNSFYFYCCFLLFSLFWLHISFNSVFHWHL